MMPSRIPFPLGLAAAALAVAACSIVGATFTARTAGTWYLTITKPEWTPSGRFIAAVWTLLFALIAVSSALVWRERLDVQFTSALALNLVLNVLWSWLFFARQSPPAALAELFVLELTCIALAIVAWRISRLAGALLLPYVLWVAFAGALNLAVVLLNRRR